MKVNKIEDYKSLNFNIEKTELVFHIEENEVLVESRLFFKRVQEGSSELVLNGKDLKILEFKIDDVDSNNYKYENDILTFSSNKDQFQLYTKVTIDPYNNTSCEGLYKSGDILCTQNEAEGFRKITFFYDRPDCMSVFTTTVFGDEKKFPFLLANGNLVSEDISDGVRKTVWFDPHKKPCYLFALVAGDLAKVTDTFTTRSGKDVSLEFFVDHNNEDKCEHAIESLKNSMKWDEDVYGLEYDLDVYMVVAVDSFNMGAMENKGLNIFNSQYVLAKKETATDSDFQGVEAVIGHEYFHNWTGNRVTCRDWFQLTLKEGLTVFRDQEFSADMLSRSVKRIEDVKGLRAGQFPEDASGLSHPIKPKSYVEMNNFYTATVYEKGAEVIRMIHTIIGKDNFRKGMDLYFERHDGQAVTTEDFVSAMSDASGINLEQFKVWYDQNGTPKVTVKESFNDGVYTLELAQIAKLNNENYSSLVIPLDIALFNSKGEKVYSDLLNFNQRQRVITVKMDERPILSFNRNFTAPIFVNHDQSIDDLVFLMKFDDDLFVKYESCLSIMKLIINSYIDGKDIDTDSFLDAYKNILEDSKLEYAFKAYALSTPTYQDILKEQEVYKISDTFSACEKLKKLIASQFNDSFYLMYDELKSDEFSLTAQSMGRRAFKNLCLSFLSLDAKNLELTQDQFNTSSNMTDELSSLKALSSNYDDQKSLDNFYNKWKDETLVIQKWFALQASDSKATIAKLRKLEQSPVFDIKVPNLARSVIGQFIMNNRIVLCTVEGMSYACEKILELDSFNPQIAARLSKGFSFLEKLGSSDLDLIKASFIELKSKKLSADTTEVLDSINIK